MVTVALSTSEEMEPRLEGMTLMLTTSLSVVMLSVGKATSSSMAAFCSVAAEPLSVGKREGEKRKTIERKAAITSSAMPSAKPIFLFTKVLLLLPPPA